MGREMKERGKEKGRKKKRRKQHTNIKQLTIGDNDKSKNKTKQAIGNPGLIVDICNPNKKRDHVCFGGHNIIYTYNYIYINT